MKMMIDQSTAATHSFQDMANLMFPLCASLCSGRKSRLHPMSRATEGGAKSLIPASQSRNPAAGWPPAHSSMARNITIMDACSNGVIGPSSSSFRRTYSPEPLTSPSSRGGKNRQARITMARSMSRHMGMPSAVHSANET